MFTARFLQNTKGTLPHRSKLFSRRDAISCRQIDPAQLPSDMTADAVTPERTIAPAIVDGMAPTCIQPCTDDLTIAAVEPDTEVPHVDAVSAMAHVDEAVSVEATNVETTTADVPERVPSAPATKGKKRGEKRKKLVSDSVRPKPSRRRERSAEESGAGMVAHALENEQ